VTTKSLYPNTPAGWATQARDCLKLALAQLTASQYRQVRIDRWEHPQTKTVIETGYAYGETRLTVHETREEYASPVVTDIRVTGPSGNEQFRTFRRLAGV